MQLREARLCLDCEELHTGEICPVCASEVFAFVTRWVPANERRSRPRPPAPPAAATQTSNRSRWVATGATGFAVLAAARWLWRSSHEPRTNDGAESRTERQPRSESGSRTETESHTEREASVGDEVHTE